MLFTSQHDSTNDYGVTLTFHKQPSHVSNLTTATQVDTESKNDDDTQSVETTIKHYHSTPEIPGTTNTTTPIQATFNSSLFQISYSKSTTSLKLPPSVKEYLCFQIYGKYDHVYQCGKYRAFTKAIDLIIGIESFEQQCVITKGLLWSDRRKQHMIIIGIDPFLSNSEMNEHICLENITKF